MKNFVCVEDELGVNEYLDMLPAPLKEFLCGEHCKIITDPVKLAEIKRRFERPDADSLAFMTFDTITSRLNGAELYIGSAENLLHEAGHVLDAMFGCVKALSNDMSFRLAWRNEAGKSGFSDYLTQNPYEYFAESFSDYCLELGFGCHPDGKIDMKTRCPKTWSYICKAVAILTRRGVYDPRESLL